MFLFVFWIVNFGVLQIFHTIKCFLTLRRLRTTALNWKPFRLPSLEVSNFKLLNLKKKIDDQTHNQTNNLLNFYNYSTNVDKISNEISRSQFVQIFVQIFAVNRRTNDGTGSIAGRIAESTLVVVVSHDRAARARREAGSARGATVADAIDDLAATPSGRSATRSRVWSRQQGDWGGCGLAGRDRERAKASENDRLKQTHEPRRRTVEGTVGELESQVEGAKKWNREKKREREREREGGRGTEYRVSQNVWGRYVCFGRFEDQSSLTTSNCRVAFTLSRRLFRYYTIIYRVIRVYIHCNYQQIIKGGSPSCRLNLNTMFPQKGQRSQGSIWN